MLIGEIGGKTRIKGSDHLDMVVELRVQYCRDIFQDSFLKNYLKMTTKNSAVKLFGLSIGTGL